MRTAVVLALLLPLLGLLISMPVSQAGYYQSGSITAQQRFASGKLVGHDTNVLNPVNYYAVLYVDSSQNLKLAAFLYSDDSLYLTQTVVPYQQWISGTFGGYAMSNVVSSQFYIVYMKSYNTIGTKLITYNYTAGSYLLQNFIVSGEAPFTTPTTIYDVGFDAQWTPDGRLWVAYMTQTTILNAVVTQMANAAPIKTTTIPLDFDQFWSVLLGNVGNNVYAWTWGYASTAGEGKLFNADTGAFIYGSGAGTYPMRSSVVSLNNGSMAVIFSSVNNYIATIMYTPPAAPVQSIVLYFTGVNSVAAFCMPNWYYGFFFTGPSGLNLMYYATTYAGSKGWSAVHAVTVNPSGYTQNEIYADPNAAIATYAGHPTVWSYFTGASPYYKLQSVDLFNVNNIVFTTTWSSSTMTTYSTSTSWSSVYSASTTKWTTQTQTMSALQTPEFLAALALLLCFILIPAGAFGYFLGLVGFALGSLIGAGVAFAFGQMPLWILLVILLAEAVTIFLFRDSIHIGRG